MPLLYMLPLILQHVFHCFCCDLFGIIHAVTKEAVWRWCACCLTFSLFSNLVERSDDLLLKVFHCSNHYLNGRVITEPLITITHCTCNIPRDDFVLLQSRVIYCVNSSSCQSTYVLQYTDMNNSLIERVCLCQCFITLNLVATVTWPLISGNETLW